MYRYRCPNCGGDQYSASPDKAEEPCIYCGRGGTELMANLNADPPKMGPDTGAGYRQAAAEDSGPRSHNQNP